MEISKDFNYPFLQNNALVKSSSYILTKKDDDEQLKHHKNVMSLINLYENLELLEFSSKDLQFISEELFVQVFWSIKIYPMSDYYREELESLQRLHLFQDEEFKSYFESCIQKAISARIFQGFMEGEGIICLKYYIELIVKVIYLKRPKIKNNTIHK